MKATRTISKQVQNGRFGFNTVWMRRERDGYLVSNGYSDPFFIRSPVQAKSTFRSMVASYA